MSMLQIIETESSNRERREIKLKVRIAELEQALSDLVQFEEGPNSEFFTFCNRRTVVISNAKFTLAKQIES